MYIHRYIGAHTFLRFKKVKMPMYVMIHTKSSREKCIRGHYRTTGSCKSIFALVSKSNVCSHQALSEHFWKWMWLFREIPIFGTGPNGKLNLCAIHAYFWYGS